MKCINTSHPSFVKLLQESNISSFELEITVSDWQEQNDTDDFPTLEQLQPREDKQLSDFLKQNLGMSNWVELLSSEQDKDDVKNKERYEQLEAIINRPNSREEERVRELGENIQVLSTSNTLLSSLGIKTTEKLPVSTISASSFSDSTSFRNILGRNYEEVKQEFGQDSVEGRTWTLSSIIQSLNNNPINSRLARKLGTDKIRLVNDSEFAIFVDGKTNELTINLDLLSNRLKNIKHVSKLIDALVFEELIHQTVNKVATKKEIESALKELTPTDIEQAKKYYGSSKITNYQALQELVRQDVQNRILGYTTEEVVDHPNINSILTKVWEYLKSIFIKPSIKNISDKTEYFINDNTVNYYDEPKFKKNNPNYNPNKIDASEIGAYRQELTPELTPYLSPEEPNNNVQQKTYDIILDFMKKANISQTDIYDYAEQHGIDISDINGLASPIEGLVAVVEGRELEALPEEVMHITVSIIKSVNPTLFKELISDINSYQIYKDIYPEYSQKYRNKDGSVNILKIKEEAVAKLLVQILDNQVEPKKIEQSKNLWDKIKDFFQLLFRKTSFVKALDLIQKSNLNISQIDPKLVDGVFYQTRDEIISKIEEKEKLINLKDSATKKDDKTGNPKKVYWYGLTELYARISDRSKELYDRWAKNNNITKSEYQQAVDDLKSEKGTAAHADLEHIGSIITNNEGFLLDSPLDDTSYIPKTNPEIYKKLKSYLFNKLKTYPNAKFKFEKKIVNENLQLKGGKGIGGTIDVLVFNPDNTVQILDYKFMDLDTDRYTDIPHYKITAFDNQMEGYKNILSEAYGIPKNNIKATILPFKTKYHYTKDNKQLPKFIDVEVGNVDPKQEEKDYLLPYETNDKTGIKHLDKIIDKLKSIQSNIDQIDVSKSTKKKIMKTSLLNDINKAIRHISSKHSLIPFTQQAIQYINNANKLIDGINNINEQTPVSELSEYAIDLIHTIDNIEKYTDLFSIANAEPELKKIIEEISIQAQTTKETLTKEVFEPFMKMVGKRAGVFDIVNNEVKVGNITNFFTATGRIDTAAVQTFFTYVQQANNERDFKIKDKLNKFIKIIESAGKDSFKKISKNNELIKKYSKQFYDDLDEAIKSKNFEWIQENIDVEKYKSLIKEELDYQIEYHQNRQISEDEINNLITKEKEKYSLEPKGNGWLFIQKLKQFPTQKWYSEEYKKLSQPLLDLYSFIEQINEDAYESGYLSYKDSPRTFLPKNVQTAEEKLAIKDFKGIVESIFRGLTINEEDFQYGNIDPDTGEIRNKVAKPFKNLEEGQLQSEQYEQNFMNYTKAVYNYIYKTDMEGVVKSLIKLESEKQAINTNFLGRIIKKDTSLPISEENIQLSPNNETNLDLLKDKIAQSFYGQKYVNSKNQDIVLSNAGKVFTFLNKKLKKNFNIEPFPKNLNGKQYSLMKVMDGMNKAFQLKVLGLNPYTGISQLFGGIFQSYINSGLVFTQDDINLSSWQYLQGYISSNPESKKLIAALKYFDPYIKNEKINDQIKALNNFKINSDNVQDFISVFMKAPDLLTQTSIFAALWKNMIVLDGKIHNVREYVRSLPEFQNIENAINKELFEKKVDSLIEEHSVSKKSKIVDNQLVIEGIEEGSDTAFKQKNLAKAVVIRAMGSLPEEQTRGANATIWGNSMMIFKNWIPSSIAQRFAKLQYSKDIDQWEHGRFLTMVQFNGARLHEYFLFFLDSMSSFFGLNPAMSEAGKLIKGDKSSVERIKQSYEKAKTDYTERTGKSPESFMSEAQFAQLMQRNMQSMAKEVVILAITLSAFLTVKSIADDEDRLRRSRMKALIKQLDKISDEVWFYYSPLALSQLTNGNLIPSISVLTDAMRTVEHQMIELYGISIKDDKLIEDNKVVKYYLKQFPVTNQLSAMLPFFAPDLSKDLGIEISSQSRR